MKILAERRNVRHSLLFFTALLWLLSAGACGGGQGSDNQSSGGAGPGSGAGAGTSTSTSTSSAGGAGACAAGTVECGGRCVSTQSDRDNCGACAKRCGAGEVCSNGGCALSCQASLTVCSGVCTNLKTDVAHCGSCDKACGAGEVCSNGGCALSCQASLTVCSGVCTNLKTDVAHCGACDKACKAGEVCSDGGCALSCQASLKDCNGVCTNLATDDAHCGTCEKSCAPDEVCKSSSCISNTPVELQFLNISDWHAQLDPITVSGVDLGGAAALSTYFKQDREKNPNTITLTAGDAFGASPPLSGFFNEAPAVLSLNLMGVTLDTFGNHNFDRGVAHLQSMVNLASYKFVSSNLTNLSANLSGVASPFHILTVGGIKVAVIGITNQDAPASTFPGNFGTITVAEPAAAAMAAQAAAKAAGATVFIVIAHLGASLYDPLSDTYKGPLIDFAKAVSGFHIIFGDHTDIQVNTVINDTLVLENRSRGVTYSKVALKVVPAGAMLSRSVKFVSPIASAVTPDPAITAMLAPFRSMLSSALDTPIGVASDIYLRGSNVERTKEVAIGDLIADAIRARYGTELALINSGGIRAPLPSSYLPANLTLRRNTAGYAFGPPYDLVGGDIYTVLPFGNVVVTRTVTGAQLWAMMEHGLGSLPAPIGGFPQISGFRVTFSAGAPAGARVLMMTLAGGAPIPKDGTIYTLSTIDFLNTGGDGYTMLADGTGTTREVMADVVLDYIKSVGTITPATDGRITALP